MRTLLCLLIAAGLAGCSLVGDDTTRASGVVVDAATGAPVAGIDVSFRTGRGVAAYTAVATDRTDENGIFNLESDAANSGSAGLTLAVNACASEQRDCRTDARYADALLSGAIPHGSLVTNLRLTLIPVQP